MISLSSLNPYALYIKLGLAAIVIAGLVWLGWHEMGIRADLTAKTIEAQQQKDTAGMYARQFNDYIKLNKEIADAIQNVKIKSNNYIQAIESSSPPAVRDGGNVVLVPAGVPAGPAVPALSGFKNHSSGGTSARAPGDPGHEARE